MPGDVTELPDGTPRVTLARWIMGRPVKGRDGELLVAFAHVEKLKGGIRRLTADAWMREFNDWRDAPRG